MALMRSPAHDHTTSGFTDIGVPSLRASPRSSLAGQTGIRSFQAFAHAIVLWDELLDSNACDKKIIHIAMQNTKTIATTATKKARQEEGR